MNTVTLCVVDRRQTTERALKALGGEPMGARITFESPELLWRVLTAKRWQLLRAMAGAGPMAIREAARRVGRDVKAVHSDVHALLDAGILERSADKRVHFPYDAIHVDFVLEAA